MTLLCGQLQLYMYTTRQEGGLIGHSEAAGCSLNKQIGLHFTANLEYDHCKSNCNCEVQSHVGMNCVFYVRQESPNIHSCQNREHWELVSINPFIELRYVKLSIRPCL